jgi:adenylate cyclase
VLAAIVLLAWGIAFLFTTLATGPAGRANDFFYDLFYRARPEADLTGDRGNVVLVAADQESLDAVNERFKFGWPWPREFWGHIAAYLDKAGARAIAFDIVFIEPSAYGESDDDNFRDLLKGIKTPLVFGAEVKVKEGKGAWERFRPAEIEGGLKDPQFGAVNVGDDKIYRWYKPAVYGLPSLAAKTVATVGAKAPAFANAPFLLHYYGPHQKADGKTTFPFIQAVRVLGAQLDAAKGESYGITPEMFKGKIVVLCGTATATYDLKSSPLSEIYPGPEVQATAMENLLRGQRVLTMPGAVVAMLSLVMAAAVAAGVMLPRRAVAKAAVPVLCVAGVLLVAVALFRGIGGAGAETIRWLPPVQPLLAMASATPAAFAWTYFAEDRQRRVMLRALSKVVSPTVAEQLSREPERLARATVRTELTILFSDLAGFTDLSEGLDVQTLGAFMNRYLGAMSDQVLSQDGTLDKYIGDAVMAFWNAPLAQEDHAARACRAALRMVQAEKELFAQMAAESAAAGGPAGDGRGGGTGLKKTYTRIGINTAGVAVGFIGSEHLFNYTCLGDGVNLASRLEGANKLYGSRAMLSHNTAVKVKELFWLRQLDVLRVKGKLEPMAVYELLGERGAEREADARFGRLTEGYAKAFAAYQRQEWAEAEKLLLELSIQFGEDGPVDALLERVREYRVHPPAASWDGVYVSTSK